MAEAKSGIASSEGKETLPDQLKKAFQAGTEARKGLKGLAEKAKLISAWVVGVLLLIGMVGIFIPYVKEEIPGVASATEQRNSVATIQPNVHETVAVWKRTESGEIPVGVWSETFHIKVGCKADYDAGVGKDFKVRYRFYSLEWKELQPGTWPATSEAQFMLLRPRTTVPIKVTCS